MTLHDQDIENRLKCLNVTELAELLDFVIPNRTRLQPADQLKSDVAANQTPLTH